MNMSASLGGSLGERSQGLRARIGAFENRYRLRERLSALFQEGERKLLEGEHFANPDYTRKVRRWYARLEIDNGASLSDVRKAYRGLMRRYHPDHFVHDTHAEALASEVAQGLNEAYRGLLVHFGEG